MSRKLIRTLGFVALLAGVGKMLRFRAWQRAGGPEAKHWAKHWRRPDGPKHPRFSRWEKRSERRAEQPGPGAEAGTADSSA